MTNLVLVRPYLRRDHVVSEDGIQEPIHVQDNLAQALEGERHRNRNLERRMRAAGLTATSLKMDTPR